MMRNRVPGAGNQHRKTIVRTYRIVMYLLIACVQCAQAQVEVATAEQFSPVEEHTGALDNVPVKPL